MIFRTAGCTEYDHPEFTVVFDREPPSDSSVSAILDHLQSAVVTGGLRFVPGQSIALGIHPLRIVHRSDGTLGVTERVGGDAWEEHVDQTMRDLWLQAAAAAQLGLAQDLSVSDDDFAAVQPCARDASTLLLNRHEDLHARYVWAVGCGDDHDHADWVHTDLFRVWLAFPFTAQFLPLPRGTGVVVHRDQVSAAGGVVADVSYQGSTLTPDAGMYFGPEPDPAAPLAVVETGDGLYRTGIGAHHDHPEFVIRLSKPPVPGLQDALAQWLLDYLQDSIAEGTRFSPGETIQVGWRTLRVAERGDGNLGLHERIDGQWEEHVEQTLRDLWFQKEVVASVDLTDRLSFPNEDQSAAVARCAGASDAALLLSRSDPEDQSTSGWLISCAHDHRHPAWASRPLVGLVESHPSITQFLALPVHASVTLNSAHLTPTGRIGVQIRVEGRDLSPMTGSYLAALAE